MQHWSRPLVVPLGALLVAVCTACGATTSGSGATAEQSPAVSGEPIVIGAALASTSSVALLGKEEVDGVRLAEQYVNAHGGVDGRPLKVVLQDTAGDEAGALQAFQTLITKEKVLGIVGPTISQQAFTADPTADRAGVPVLGPSNTAAGIPQIGQFISRVSAPATEVEPYSVRQALNLDPTIKTVAVAYADNDAYSRSETKTFQHAVKSTGLTLATVVTYQTTDTDFTAPAGKILQVKPQLVIVSGLASDAGALIKRLYQLGYRGRLIGGNGLNTVNVFKPCGRACHGMLIAQAYSPQENNSVNRAFVEAYRSLKGTEPSQFCAQGFTAVQVMAEALATVARRESLSTMDLRTQREKLNAQIVAGDYSTPLGLISFTPEGEVVQRSFYVASITMRDDQNGQFSYE